MSLFPAPYFMMSAVVFIQMNPPVRGQAQKFPLAPNAVAQVPGTACAGAAIV